MKSLGLKIKYIRVLLKLSQSELAKVWNYKSRQVISKIENGTAEPYFKDIMKLKLIVQKKLGRELDLLKLVSNKYSTEDIFETEFKVPCQAYEEINNEIPKFYNDRLDGEVMTGDLMIESILSSNAFPAFVNNCVKAYNLISITKYYEDKIYDAYQSHKNKFENIYKSKKKELEDIKVKVYISGIDLLNDLMAH